MKARFICSELHQKEMSLVDGAGLTHKQLVYTITFKPDPTDKALVHASIFALGFAEDPGYKIGDIVYLDISKGK